MNLQKYITDYFSEPTRNPVLEIDGIRIGIIGDVHIGKTFRTGVPKDRLGERESMILSQLKDLLRRPVNYTVIVGDLFDKIRVSNSDLYNLITIIEEALKEDPERIIVIINGNHDMPKETDRISSFQLFEKYFNSNSFKNLKIVSKHLKQNFVSATDDLLLYFSHYNAFLSLDQEVPKEDFDFASCFKYKVAFGHWETIDFGSDHFIDRDVPALVKDNFDVVITGHEHKPKLTLLDDTPVLTSGSMQPYAYGEELPAETEFYCTLKTEEVNKCLEDNPDYFINSYVRILTQDGDNLPQDFKCLGRTLKALPKKDSNPSLDLESNNTNPLSFAKAFVDLVKVYQEECPEQKDFLSKIEQTFLDKSYKENT